MSTENTMQDRMPTQQHRLGIGHAQGAFQRRERRFLPQKGNVGLAHDPQVHGIQGDHGQDPGQERRDLLFRMEQGR
jgi:hypothetical protein